MDEQVLFELFEYDSWATRKILARCSGLDSEAWRAEHAGGLSLQSTLAHVLNACMIWRQRSQGVPREQSKRVSADDFPSPEDLDRAWASEERLWRDWLASLTPELLAAPMTMPPTGLSLPLWQYMLQVLMHGAQHRAEAALMLTELGRSPGEVDFLRYAADIRGYPPRS